MTVWPSLLTECSSGMEMNVWKWKVDYNIQVKLGDFEWFKFCIYVYHVNECLCLPSICVCSLFPPHYASLTSVSD